MSLTLHYGLHAATASSYAARQLVNQLRPRTMTLPFDHVGPIETVETVAGRSPWDDDVPSLWPGSIEDPSVLLP